MKYKSVYNRLSSSSLQYDLFEVWNSLLSIQLHYGLEGCHKSLDIFMKKLWRFEAHFEWENES